MDWYCNHTYRHRTYRHATDLYVFLSYTSRESEVQVVQPLIDEYCRELWEWADRNGLHVFYDHFSLERRRHYDDYKLAQQLADGILESDLMTAFLSPGYIQSEWCQFEWAAQCAKLRGLQMRRDNYLDPAEHVIYWKPDIWDHTYAHSLIETQFARLYNAPMTTDDYPNPATHAIYWKPDIWDHPYSHMLNESVCDARLTDVTDVYGGYHMNSIVDAAGRCVSDTVEIVKRMFNRDNWAYDDRWF